MMTSFVGVGGLSGAITAPLVADTKIISITLNAESLMTFTQAVILLMEPLRGTVEVIVPLLK